MVDLVSSRVSVVIPAYNAEATIGEAVESALAQMVRPEEVLVVDDASTDATRDVLARDFGGQAGVTLLFRNQNGGPAAVRNQGVSKAKSEWIAFLDGDDAWLPHRLSIQFALVDKHPDVDMWCGGVARFDAAGDVTAVEAPTFRDIELNEFLFHNPVATSTVLVRRRVLEDVGGFDEQFVGPEDYDLWMRITSKCRAVLIDAPISLYRYVPGSLSMDDRKFLPHVLRVLEKAFRQDGALAGVSEKRNVAFGNQYWNASWMAFNRGARTTALRFWVKAFVLDHVSDHARQRPWAKLLYRYCLGAPVKAGDEWTSGRQA